MDTEENGLFNDYSFISAYYSQKLATADSLLEAAEKRKAQNRIAQRRSRQRLKQASAGNKEKTPERQRSNSTKSRNQESGAAASTTPPKEAEAMTDEMQQPILNQDAPELYTSPDQYGSNAWSSAETQQQISAMNEIGTEGFHTGIEKEPSFDLPQDEMMWNSQAQLPTQLPISSKPALRGPFDFPQNQKRPKFSPYKPTMPLQENMRYMPSADFPQSDIHNFGSHQSSNSDYFLFNQDFHEDYAQNMPQDHTKFNSRPSQYHRSEDGDFPRNTYNSWGQRDSEHRSLKEISNLEARFEYVLEAIETAGFENFDDLTIAYYTEQFEKGSVADLAQKTSRSRRLQILLARLRESSKSWTLWEARGYRDEIVRSAESMYVQELRRFAPRRERFQGGSGSECSYQTSSTDQSGKDNSPINSPVQGDIMDQKTRVEMLRIYQNTLPNLWALLTDLAGMGSLHSEFVVLSVVSILHKSRMHPNMDFTKLPFNMQTMFDASIDIQGSST